MPILLSFRICKYRIKSLKREKCETKENEK